MGGAGYLSLFIGDAQGRVFVALDGDAADGYGYRFRWSEDRGPEPGP